jgi:glycosyltransferase involved in cell wall biosynthesis
MFRHLTEDRRLRYSESMPAVSYVVTVYNKAPFLDAVLAAIETERAATGGEIIVLDDGSTDGSAALLDAFAAAHRDVSVIHQENRGVAAATNAAIRATRGELVRLVDGDDILVRGSTRLLQRALDESGCDYAFGLPQAYDPARPREFPHVRDDAPVAAVADPLAEMIRMQLFVPSATLGRRAVYDRVLPLPENYRTSQDFSLGVRVARTARVARVEETVCYMADVAQGRLSGSKARMFRDTALITRDFMGEWPVRYRAAAVRRNAGRAYHYARRHLPGSGLRQASLLGIKVLAYLPVAPVFPAWMRWIAGTYDEAVRDPASFP